MAQPTPGALVYEQGRSNSDSRAFFGNMPLDAGQVNPDYISVFDDFLLMHGKAFNATDMYTVVKDAGASVAISGILGGAVVLSSTATTDNDGAAIQSMVSIARQSGKKLWFEANIQVSDIDSDIFVGLAGAIVTNPEDVLLNTTKKIGIGVLSDNDGGLGLIQAIQSDGVTNSSTTLGKNMVAATYKKLGFYYDGSTLTFYVDRVAVLSSQVPAPASVTDVLAPIVFHLSGNAVGTDTLTCDYIMCVAER